MSVTQRLSRCAQMYEIILFHLLMVRGSINCPYFCNGNIQYIPWNMQMVLLHFILCWYIISSMWIYMMCLPISFRVASLASGQSYDCPSASGVTLKDMGKIRHYWTTTGPWFNIKTSSYHYRKSHCGDKTVVRSSYLRNGISYTGKMVSLYWISPQNVTKHAVSAYFFGVYCIQKCLKVLGMCVTVYVASNIHYCPIWMLILIMWWPTLSSVYSTHCLSICTIYTWVV